MKFLDKILDWFAPPTHLGLRKLVIAFGVRRRKLELDSMRFETGFETASTFAPHINYTLMKQGLKEHSFSKCLSFDFIQLRPGLPW